MVRKHMSIFHARLTSMIGAVLLSLVAIAIARAGEAAQHVFLGLYRPHPWLAAALTPTVFVAVVYATQRYAPEARGSGIPQVMAAAHDPARHGKGPLVSVRAAVVKFIGTVAMLFAGGSVGREGPTVQIAAATMVAINRALRVPITSGLIIAGGAAGVAAAFNTPLAGVAFAIEELASAFEQRVAVFVMAVVMISGLVSLGLDGDYVYFGQMHGSMPIRTMLLASPLAGVAGGIAGGLFARCLVAQAWSRWPMIAAARRRPLLTALICGMIVAATGLASGGISWGTGYETSRALLSGHDAPLIFGPAKFVANLATALSGAPGGIFAPSLSAGAGLGQLLAVPLRWAMPGSAAGPVVLLGMIGYFTGVVRAPLTAVIIMLEMTNNNGMILPLFATALIADEVSSLICRQKLYHALSLRFR